MKKKTKILVGGIMKISWKPIDGTYGINLIQNRHPIGRLYGPGGEKRAAFIVRAVNSHDALRTIALRYLSKNALDAEIERLNGPQFTQAEGK